MYFETKRNGVWEPTFEPEPADWWWEEIVHDRVDNGSAITIFGPPTDEEIEASRVKSTYNDGALISIETAVERLLLQKMESYLRSLPVKEVIETYGNDESFSWSFMPAQFHDQRGLRPIIESRDYSWFGLLADVRGGRPIIEQLGKPDDLSPLIAAEFERWSGDAHSDNHVLVSTLIEAARSRDPQRCQWLSANIPEPEQTRMVFFFDN